MLKVALITGASRGIGFDIMKELFFNGYYVVVISRKKEDILRGIDNYNDNVVLFEECLIPNERIDVFSCNITKEIEVIDTIKLVRKKFGRIDVLINNAGIIPQKADIIDELESNFDLTFKTNFKGAWYFTREVLPIMIKQGSGYIFNISSMSGKRVFKGRSSYSISKFAVNALTEAILRENKEFGIKATAICPGYVNTESLKEIIKQENLNPEHLIQKSDISKTILYLLSLSPKAYVKEVCLERELW